MIIVSKQYGYEIPNESWGETSIISPELVVKLDAYCRYLQTKPIVTSGTQGEHVSQWHRMGMAVDFIPWCLIDRSVSLFDCYLKALKFKLGGVGIYPHWKHNGLIVGGLHFDVRPASRTASWMGVLVNEKQEYFSVTNENLKKYGVI